MPPSTSETLWIRCGTTGHQEVADNLKTRLLADDDPIDILITGPTMKTANPQGERAVTNFLANTSPNALLWLGGAIDHATVFKCLGQSIPVGCADLEAEHVKQLRKRNLLRRNRLDQIHFVMARDEEARQALIRLGVPANVIETSQELMPDLPSLPCDEDERHAFAGQLGTRPTWLAAGANLSDVDMLAKAFKHAARASHRLLLTIVTPEKPEQMAESFASNGLTVSLQSTGDHPTDDVQVYIADSMDELGLFFRVASMTLICCTFGAGAKVDPFGAAALGCAIISGPQFAPYANKFQRLRAEGAVCIVENTDDLGGTVVDLLSVEKTARMANAGWEVSTKGLDVLDRLEDLTRRHLLRFGA